MYLDDYFSVKIDIIWILMNELELKIYCGNKKNLIHMKGFDNRTQGMTGKK